MTQEITFERNRTIGVLRMPLWKVREFFNDLDIRGDVFALPQATRFVCKYHFGHVTDFGLEHFADTARRLLSSMKKQGLVREQEPGYYAITPLGKQLKRTRWPEDDQAVWYMDRLKREPTPYENFVEVVHEITNRENPRRDEIIDLLVRMGVAREALAALIEKSDRSR